MTVATHASAEEALKHHALLVLTNRASEVASRALYAKCRRPVANSTSLSANVAPMSSF